MKWWIKTSAAWHPKGNGGCVSGCGLVPKVTSYATTATADTDCSASRRRFRDEYKDQAMNLDFRVVLDTCARFHQSFRRS